MSSIGRLLEKGFFSGIVSAAVLVGFVGFLYLAGGVMCGGLAAFAIYRSFILGLVWVEYDMEKVIFHYSRKEE